MINLVTDFINTYFSFNIHSENGSSSDHTPGWMLATAAVGLLGILYLGYKKFSPQKSIPNNLAVLVRKYPANDGIGDIVIGEKLLAILKRNFSALISTITPEDEYTEGFFKEKNIIYLPFNELENKVKESSTLVIHTPVLMEPFTLALDKKSQAIHIGEYSNEGIIDPSVKKNPYSLGVGPHEWGIFCDKDGLALRKKMTEKGIEYDLQLLKNVEDDLLKKEILGNLTVEEYAKDSKIYSGYTHAFYSVRNFLLPIAFYEKDNQQNIDVVITGKRHLDSELFGKLMASLVQIKENLNEAGIGELEVLSFDEKRNLFDKNSIQCNAKNTKKMRLFLPGTISKEMKHAIEVASVPLRLATGDNSLSESLGIAFLYENKGKRASFFHLCTLAKKLKLFLAEQFLIAGKIESGNWSLIDYNKVAELMRNPELKKEWLILADYIHKNCNVEEIFTKNIQDIIVGKFNPNRPKTVLLPR